MTVKKKVKKRSIGSVKEWFRIPLGVMGFMVVLDGVLHPERFDTPLTRGCFIILMTILSMIITYPPKDAKREGEA